MFQIQKEIVVQKCSNLLDVIETMQQAKRDMKSAHKKRGRAQS
jgi:hypothetical protein